jgi:hypothetical protein
LGFATSRTAGLTHKFPAERERGAPMARAYRMRW